MIYTNSTNSRALFNGRLHIISFLSYLVVLQVSAFYLSQQYSVQSLLASLTAMFYMIIDSSIVVEGNRLIHADSNRYIIVDQQCTAFALIATLTALLMSFPNTLANKIKSVAWIMCLVQLENIIRISHLYYLVVQNSDLFNFYHLYLWQGINFVYAVGLFLLFYRIYYTKVSRESC